MNHDPTLAHEREELIGHLCTLVKWVPIVLTFVWGAAALTAVITFATGHHDRAALTVALALTPCVVLAWIMRHLTLRLLDMLDIEPAPESPRH
jgi:hypothetical protein